jgi:hypothetical protein
LVAIGSGSRTADKWGKLAAAEDLEDTEGGHLGKGREAGKQATLRSRTEDGRNHQESELFLRSGRGEGERREIEQVGGKRQAASGAVFAAGSGRYSLSAAISWGFRGEGGGERSA